LAEGIMVDLLRDFWIRETGTGQQVVQLHEIYMMMIMIKLLAPELFFLILAHPVYKM
jgi:hypothetical protein